MIKMSHESGETSNSNQGNSSSAYDSTPTPSPAQSKSNYEYVSSTFHLFSVCLFHENIAAINVSRRVTRKERTTMLEKN
jgi:hypothetical protein